MKTKQNLLDEGNGRTLTRLICTEENIQLVARQIKSFIGELPKIDNFNLFQSHR